MKKSMYKSAYRVVSWLSDVSGGASAFVRWKVALAALIIGVSATSLPGCKPTCYEPAEEVSCYDPVVECYAAVEEDDPSGEETGRTVPSEKLEPLPAANDGGGE